MEIKQLEQRLRSAEPDEVGAILDRLSRLKQSYFKH